MYTRLGLDFNPAVDKAAAMVKRAKAATEKANVLADKYQITQKHWDKLSAAERSFQRSLQLIDKVAPARMQGMSKKIGGQVGIIALIAALGLIGSTLLLHVWVSRGSNEDEGEAEGEVQKAAVSAETVIETVEIL